MAPPPTLQPHRTDPPVPAEGAGRVPLYRTIADAVIRDIRRGRYLEGARLPASRDLAQALE